MNLACIYLKHLIDADAPLYAVCLPGGYGYAALSSEAISRIPKSQRKSEPCASGLNIHRASCGRNCDSFTIWKEFTKEDFAFSISEEAASTYLPGLIQVLAQCCM